MSFRWLNNNDHIKVELAENDQSLIKDILYIFTDKSNYISISWNLIKLLY